MQNAVTAEGVSYSNDSQRMVRRERMPLSFLKAGDHAKIAKLREKGELHHHLENLGFVEGAEVFIVSENGGNLIIEIKGTQVAIDKKVAQKIITC